MNNKFNVEATFYKEEIRKQALYLRKYLTIENSSLNKTAKNALIIMLNPGSCGDSEINQIKKFKLDTNIKNLDLDPTLIKIKDVMIESGITKSVVINLYNNMEPLSEVLKRDVCPIDSIFNVEKEKEKINSLIIDSTCIILGWGILEGKILNHAKEIYEKFLKNYKNKIVAFTKNSIENNNYSCYHPLVRKSTLNKLDLDKLGFKNNWVEEIVRQINEIN